jgi:hypothetical protein
MDGAPLPVDRIANAHRNVPAGRFAVCRARTTKYHLGRRPLPLRRGTDQACAQCRGAFQPTSNNTCSMFPTRQTMTTPDPSGDTAGTDSIRPGTGIVRDTPSRTRVTGPLAVSDDVK